MEVDAKIVGFFNHRLNPGSYISVVLFHFVFLTFDIFSGTHVRTGNYTPELKQQTACPKDKLTVSFFSHPASHIDSFSFVVELHCFQV